MHLQALKIPFVKDFKRAGAKVFLLARLKCEISSCISTSDLYAPAPADCIVRARLTVGLVSKDLTEIMPDRANGVSVSWIRDTSLLICKFANRLVIYYKFDLTAIA